MDRPSLVVIIPAYREGTTIGPVVASARIHAPVIVVDDFSPDDTGARAAAEGAVVLRNEVNRGYEGSLNNGFAKAQEMGFEYAVTLDADGEHDPSLLAEFGRLLTEEKIPLVLGVRPRKQRFAEIVMGLYVKARYGADDILCGMKGYQLRLVTEHGGFDLSRSIGTELAIDAMRRGIPFRQIGVHGQPRQDAPRFDRRFAANWRIFKALGTIIRQDLRSKDMGAIAR